MPRAVLTSLRNTSAGNRNLLKRADDTVSSAIEKYNGEQFEEAYQLYYTAIELFMRALETEKNSQSKEKIRKRLSEYIDRAEELKTYLVSGDSSKKSDAATDNMDFLEQGIDTVKKAIEIANEGEYEEALPLYRTTVKLFEKAVDYERNPRSKSLIREKLEEYRIRADRIQHDLATADREGRYGLAPTCLFN